MNLMGKLKEKADKAESKEQSIRQPGSQLTDEEMKHVVGGISADQYNGLPYKRPPFAPTTLDTPSSDLPHADLPHAVHIGDSSFSPNKPFS